MSNALPVYKNRDNKVEVDFGEDISGLTFTSEIRVGPDVSTELIAAWNVAFSTDGTDGILVLTMSDVITAQIESENGYMDIKQVEPGVEALAYPLFDDPIEVVFKGTVTQ